MALSRFVTKLFLLNFVLIFCAAFFGSGQIVQAQNVCSSSNLTEEVAITAEKNNENRTATIGVTLNSPPFTNENINSFSISPGGDQPESTFNNTLQTEVQASYDPSTTEFTVTVEVDLDCSGNQGVLKTKDFDFSEAQDETSVDPNFGYSVDGENNIEVTALSPTSGGYSHQWYIGSDSATGFPDFTNQSASFNADDYSSTGLSIDVTLGVEESDGTLVGETTKSIPTLQGESESDSDGDGTPDSEEEEEDDDDDDNGGGDDEDGGDGDTEGLVNCGNPGADGELQESEMCDYQALMSMIQEVINWLIGILVMIATLLFMYAGFLYFTAAGSESKVETAKEIFWNVAGGFLIVLLAFTLIATLVNLLTSEDWRDNWEQAIPIELSVESEFDNQLL